MKIHICERTDRDFADRLFGWNWWWQVRDGYYTIGSGFARTRAQAQEKAEKLARRGLSACKHHEYEV